MAKWKDGEQRSIVFFDYAVGVTVSCIVGDDDSPPLVGQDFLVKVNITVIKGGFPVRVRLTVPAHMRIEGVEGVITVLETDAALPGSNDYLYSAKGLCELNTKLEAELVGFDERDTRYPYVNLRVANAPFPNPVPEPPLGKIIFGRGANSRCLVTSDGSGERAIDIKPTNYEVGVLSPQGTRRAACREDGVYNDLWVENHDGGNAKRLTYNTVASDPQWSPDGARIMFSVFGGGRWTLRSINADDGTDDREEVASTDTKGEVHVYSGVYMRDGRFGALVFQRSTGVQQLVLGTLGAFIQGGPFTVRDELVYPLRSEHSYRNLTSNQNHDVLAMEAENRSQPNSFQIHLFSALGNQGFIDGLNARAPCFSPDGNWIAVSKRGIDTSFISRVDINGFAEVQLSKNPPYVPTGLADGDFRPSWGRL